MSNNDSVTRVRASAVLDEFDYDVQFSSESDAGRMRVIYAPNGRGKTNFLRAVNSMLNPTLESLQLLVEIPIRGLRIDFASGAIISLLRQSAFEGSFVVGVQLNDDSPVVEVSVDPADFAGRLFRRVWDGRAEYNEYCRLVTKVSAGAILIGDDRLSPPIDDARDLSRAEVARRRAAGTVSRQLENVERMLTQSAFATLSTDTRGTGVYAGITRTTLQGTQNLTTAASRKALETQIRKLLKDGKGHEKYGLLSLGQVRDISRQLRAARANAKNLPTLHRILTPYLDSLQEQVRALEPAQQLIDIFVTAVNRFLDRKELRFSAATGIRLFGRKNVLLSPESLSSGERHLLLLLSHAMLANRDGSFLIVDEPELSLGIEWQRDLLAALMSCSASTRVQFLVASHSVQVMSGLEDGAIVGPTEVSV